MTQVRITTLVENTVRRRGLLAQEYRLIPVDRVKVVIRSDVYVEIAEDDVQKLQRYRPGQWTPIED